MTEVIHKMYTTCEIKDSRSKSFLIALPTKPGDIECELHRTVSPMSKETKLALRITMNRECKEQCTEILYYTVSLNPILN